MRTLVNRLDFETLESAQASLAAAIKAGSTNVLPTFSQLEVGKVYKGKIKGYRMVNLNNDGQPQHLMLYVLDVQINPEKVSEETVSILEANILPLGYEGEVEAFQNPSNGRKINRWYVPVKAGSPQMEQTVINPVNAQAAGQGGTSTPAEGQGNRRGNRS